MFDEDANLRALTPCGESSVSDSTPNQRHRGSSVKTRQRGPDQPEPIDVPALLAHVVSRCWAHRDAEGDSEDAGHEPNRSFYTLTLSG
jgi:hypothetical protein